MSNQNIESELFSKISNSRNVINNKNAFPIEKLTLIVKEVISTLKSNHKIAFVGNGGSAAEAMHLAAEFTGKCVKDHEPWNAICLNESQSALTAIANDFGVEQMFARMVKANLQKGDLLFVLSTSGKSPNILRAIEAANTEEIRTILLTGDYEVNVETWMQLNAPSSLTPRIQELHLIWGHYIAELVELSF